MAAAAAVSGLSSLLPFLVLLFLAALQPSSSRPINAFLSASANIALPGDRQLDQPQQHCGDARASPVDSETPNPEMTPGKYCEDGETVPPPSPPAPTTKQQLLAERYTPLLLNFFPRGRVPPSGPSPGINDNKT